MKKCNKTISGKHLWNKIITIGTGKYGKRMEDTNPIMGKETMELVDYEITKTYNKCSACGLIDDINELTL